MTKQPSWARKRALESMAEWALVPLQASMGELVRATALSRLLVRRGWLQAEELNDGRILGQTSLAGIPVLASADRVHILSIDAVGLRQAFLDLDMMSVLPRHPRA